MIISMSVALDIEEGVFSGICLTCWSGLHTVRGDLHKTQYMHNCKGARQGHRVLES